jgi:hypothetical protein
MVHGSLENPHDSFYSLCLVSLMSVFIAMKLSKKSKDMSADSLTFKQLALPQL